MDSIGIIYYQCRVNKRMTGKEINSPDECKIIPFLSFFLFSFYSFKQKCRLSLHFCFSSALYYFVTELLIFESICDIITKKQRRRKMNNNYNNRTGGGNDNSFGSGFADDSFSGGSYSGSDGNGSFGSDNSFGGNSSFGGDDNFDPNAPLYHPEPMTYDPNAPLYHPEPITYDPNAPLYHPENNTPISSYTSSTVATKKSSAQTVTIVAIVIAVAVVLGIVGYKMFIEKKTLKDYFETSEGRSALAMLNSETSGVNRVKETKVYVEGDDILVFDATYDFDYMPPAGIEMMKSSLDELRPGWQTNIKNIMDREKIKTFSVKFVYRLSNGESFYDYTISL